MEEIDYCCISRFFPEDWEDVIKQEPAVISPLHDKDVTEDGERKTALPCDFKL